MFSHVHKGGAFLLLGSCWPGNALVAETPWRALRAGGAPCSVLRGAGLVTWVMCRAGQWSCCVKVTFFLKKILRLSLFLLVVTRFCVNYVLLVRLKIRRAALIANTFLFLQLLLLCYYKRGDGVIG